MIIRSLLDTDLYKFTMMQVVLHHFPGAQVEYRFKCRNPGIDLTPYVDEIRDEIRGLCSLRFAPDELTYSARMARSSRAISSISSASSSSTSASSSVEPLEGSDGEIDITIRGPWLHTIMFRGPVLAIVSEVYDRNVHPRPELDRGSAARLARRRSTG